jgi:hypothetical protein
MISIVTLLLIRLTSSDYIDDWELKKKSFVEWTKRFLDAKLNPVEPIVNEFGMSVVASRDIVPGDIYSYVPVTHTIGVDLALESAEAGDVCKKVFDECPDHRPEFDCIALYLIAEKRKGAKSKWAPYFDVLPANFYHVPADTIQKGGDSRVAGLVGSNACYVLAEISVREDADVARLFEVESGHVC